jgi:hypothetical protein
LGAALAKTRVVGGLASGADGIAGGDADRTGGVCPREGNSSPNQPIQIRRVNISVAQSCDRIKPLLIGHQEQNMGLTALATGSEIKVSHVREDNGVGLTGK